jgi:hypothetical protein
MSGRSDRRTSTTPGTLIANAYYPHTCHIHLQKLLKSFLTVLIDDALVHTFVKNAHGLKLLRGKQWGAVNSDPVALGL